MKRTRLVGLGLVVAIASVATSHYIANILNANYYAKYGSVANDTDVMLWGFTLLCVYMPLIAVSCTVVVFLVGWFAMTKRNSTSLKQWRTAAVTMIAITMILSFLWSAVIIFT